MIKDRRRGPGFIYLIRGDDNWHRIGRTASPDKRFRHYRHNPSLHYGWKLSLVSLYAVPHQEVAERYLHKAFEHRRTGARPNTKSREEWFDLSPANVRQFEIECGKIEEAIKMPTHWWWPQ